MPVLEEKERSASYKPVFVTEITDDLHFYVQDVETGEWPSTAGLQLPRGPAISGREPLFSRREEHSSSFPADSPAEPMLLLPRPQPPGPRFISGTHK